MLLLTSMARIAVRRTVSPESATGLAVASTGLPSMVTAMDPGSGVTPPARPGIEYSTVTSAPEVSTWSMRPSVPAALRC